MEHVQTRFACPQAEWRMVLRSHYVKSIRYIIRWLHLGGDLCRKGSLFAALENAFSGPLRPCPSRANPKVRETGLRTTSRTGQGDEDSGGLRISLDAFLKFSWATCIQTSMKIRSGMLRLNSVAFMLPLQSETSRRGSGFLGLLHCCPNTIRHIRRRWNSRSARLSQHPRKTDVLLRMWPCVRRTLLAGRFGWRRFWL